MALRRALALSAVDRYAAMMISLGIFAATGRILGPVEVGTAVLGLTAYALIEIIRDVPTAYLVQQSDANVPAVQSAFTIMAAISLIAAVALLLGAPALAHAVGNDGMADFFRIIAAALLLGPFERPLVALMRRDLAFDRVAVVNIASGVVNGAVVIGLALAGFGAVSFAWALLGANLAAVATALAISPHRRTLGIATSEWRKVLLIGGSSGVWGLIARYTDSLPQIAFGALALPASAGNYSRAQTIVELPGKLLFVVVSQVALPALAAQRRDGGKLKGAVLDSLAVISVLQWPAFLLIACLAHPLVLLLLGPRWLDVVPLVRVLAIARLFAPLELMVYPLLLSAQATGRLLLSAAIPACLYTPVIFALAPSGAFSVACAYLVLIPLNAALGYLLIRRDLAIGIADVLGAVKRSFVVTLGSALGPVAILAANGFRLDLPFSAAAAIVVTAAIGWVATIVVSEHLLSAELRHLTAAVRRQASLRLGAGS